MFKAVWVLCILTVISINFVSAAERPTVLERIPVSVHTETATSMEMVNIKGACFLMGASVDDVDAYPEEFPAHEVCLDDFLIGKYEVTVGQWRTIMGSYTSTQSGCIGDRCPVDAVSWDDIQVFINKMNGNNRESKFRLPTEAEWEYAARSGGKNERYSGGDNLNTVAWFAENSGRKNHPVGTKAPNGLGIYDMTGNVWEWTNDWYGSDYYTDSPRRNPLGPVSGEDRVVRGGCVTGEAANQRVSRRTAHASDFRKPALGFRLVKLP